MRRFANLYIILFLVDAGLSLVDELLKRFAAPLPLFSDLRYFVAYLVITMSAVLFACLGVDRRLPKRVFLPLALYISWCTLALWPLSGLIGRGSLGLASALGQVLLGGVALLLLRRPGGSFLLTADQFRPPLFSWRNTLVFSAFNLLLFPFMLIFSVLAITSNYLDVHTAGFMRISPIGIYMSERSYHHADKIVRLVGMMHIGKEDFYEDLADSMPSDRTIILAEGVTDRDGLLVTQFNYSKLAGIIGLSSQEKMSFRAHPVDLNRLAETGSSATGGGKPDIARADIDLSRFNPQTIEFLNALGRTLLSGKPLAEGLAEYNAWADDQMTPERVAGVMADILDKRNAVVVDGMERSLKYYDTIIIPWGAMHMPGIEKAVLARGFSPAASQERLSLDFRTIPFAALLRSLSVHTSAN